MSNLPSGHPPITMAGKGQWICHSQHHEGYLCTRARAHKGDHAAHDDHGEIVMKWRGGRADWSHVGRADAAR